MGNADIMSQESKGPGGDEDPAVRARDFIGFAAGVAGTVAAFLIGFGILPNDSLPEQSLNFCAAIGLSGAIVAGIGAWRSLRRFVIMWMFIGLAVTCLAALAVVAQRQAPPRAATSVNGGTPTNSAHPSATSVTPPRTTAATAPAVVATSSPVEFSGQSFSIQGNGCGDINNYPSVLFSGQGPRVTDADENVGSFGPFNVTGWDIYLDCWYKKISFYGKAAILQGTPSPSACEMQLNTDPLPGTYAFSQLTAGMQFCLDGADGNNLVYVKLLSVSDTSYTTTWAATAWTIDGN
jgi:hypothetical protein